MKVTPLALLRRQDRAALEKFSAPVSRTLEALLRSDAAQQALADEERVRLAQRQALVDRLAVARERAADPARMKARGAAVDKAGQALRAAEQALKRAQAEHREALSAEYAQRVADRAGVEDLELELRQSAPSILADLKFRLSGLVSDDLVLALQVWPDEVKRRDGIVPPLSSNRDLVVAAKEAILAAIGELESMQLAVLSMAEIAIRIERLMRGLEEPLGKLQINPPRVDLQSLECGAPRPWSGRSSWMADEPIQPLTAAEEAKARAERLAPLAEKKSA